MGFIFNCLGILRENKNSKYEFVVRWFINDADKKQITYLPSPKGEFHLRISTIKSKEYIKSDGTVAPISGPMELPVIKPLNYLMIVPPTDPTNGTTTRPTGPIDPKDMQGTSGVGIYHILAEPRPSRYSKKIIDKTIQRIQANKVFSTNGLFHTLSVEAYARSFTHFLINNQIRPADLQALFLQAFDKLEQFTFPDNNIPPLEKLPGLFTFHLPEIPTEVASLKKPQFTHMLNSIWQSATLLKDLLKDVDYLKAINKDKEDPENLKSQFSFLGIQGAEIIDYWCNPEKSQSNRVEADCGKKYACSEAIGLGTTLGSIDAAVVRNWLDTGDAVTISVEYIPPVLSNLLNDDTYNWKELHDEALLEDIPPMTSISTAILNQGTNSIENALHLRSSCPPATPKAAVVDHDLFLRRHLTDLDNGPIQRTNEFAEKMEIPTGDGRVQFTVTKPDPKIFPEIVRPDNAKVLKEDLSSIINGVNIYGIWEPEADNAYRKYFTNPSLQPTIDELGPWLITRRYSYNKEISAFFEPGNSNVQANQEKPPRSAAFQSPGNVVNSHKILHVNRDHDVEYETMPNLKMMEANEEVVVFSLNIREGFKNQFNANTLQSWDKFPKESTIANWKPGLWKSDVIKDHPQGYRFWATAVDIFGQESQPIPISIKETATTPAGHLFYFKYRSPLQPPPSNDEKKTDYIKFWHTGNDLMLTWESPFGGSLGNFSDTTSGNPNQPERISKALLLANLIYLRRPHNTASRDIPDDKIDEYIGTNIFPALPSTFRNDKWKIGFREILKHNANWQVHKTAEKLTNTILKDNIWTHTLVLEEMDKGFDYMVMINFEIKPDGKQCWTDNDTTRKLNIKQQTRKNPINQDFYLSDSVDIEEMPCISNIAFTTSLLVSNPYLPKLLTIRSVDFKRALPVLGIQGINRDLLLSNLVTTPDKIEEVDIDGRREPAVVFTVNKDENSDDILYTASQRTMIDAALKRCGLPGNTDFSVPERILRVEMSNLNRKIYPALKDSTGKDYQIFTGKSDEDIISGGLTGFRGIKLFRLRYDSIYADPGSKNQSEALKYHVYQTRVQLTGIPGANSSFESISFKMDGGRRFTNVKFNIPIKIENLIQPVFVVINYEDGYSISQVTKFSEDKNEYVLELAEPLPGSSETTLHPEKLFVLISTQLMEKEFEVNEKGYYEEDLLLPVGGGVKELFIWSISTSSSLGRFSSESLHQSQLFQSSILPPTLIGFTGSTINSQEEKAAYVLSKSNHRQWLPSELHNTPGDLSRFARNYIKWSNDQRLPDDVFVAIEREARQEEMPWARLLTETGEWELAAKIEKSQLKDGNKFNQDGSINENYNPYGLISLDWISATQRPSLYRWLYEAAEIQVPGDMSVMSTQNRYLTGPLSSLFDTGARLTTAGIISDPLDKEKNSMFIDYFYSNEDLKNEMDTFRSYNYRIQTYIDIDPDEVTNPHQKYLYSKPTEWTGWIRPTFPEIEKLEKVERTSYSETLQTPEVEFVFVLDELHTFGNRDILNPIFYRIIVKKSVNNSISTYHPQSKGSAFLEVGTIIDMPIKAVSSRIIDKSLEREDIDVEIINTYMIEVMVITKDSSGQIQVIRKGRIEEHNITIGKSAGGKEVHQTVTFRIV